MFETHLDSQIFLFWSNTADLGGKSLFLTQNAKNISHSSLQALHSCPGVKTLPSGSDVRQDDPAASVRYQRRKCREPSRARSKRFKLFCTTNMPRIRQFGIFPWPRFTKMDLFGFGLVGQTKHERLRLWENVSVCV